LINDEKYKKKFYDDAIAVAKNRIPKASNANEKNSNFSHVGMDFDIFFSIPPAVNRRLPYIILQYLSL